MSRPTVINVLESNRIILKVSVEDEPASYFPLGFVDYGDWARRLLRLTSDDPHMIFAACERLRDMGVPFKFNRTGGADYFAEAFRNEGFLRGKFKRLRVLGDDWDTEAPFVIEEF